MAWVLIEIPTVKFGRINALVEIARVEGVRIETTSNNATQSGQFSILVKIGGGERKK